MPEDKSPLEQALDLLVYAPLGLALTVQEEMPKLVEKGRTRVTGQVMMARMIGQFAVQQGQREAEKQVQKAAERFSNLGFVAREADKPTPAPAAPAAASPAASAAPSPGAAAPARSAGTATDGAAAAKSTNGGGVPPVDQLAIPGYDSLSAGQVVQRLAGLSGEELEAVARYEAATRHRKTILGRVAQLQNAG